MRLRASYPALVWYPLAFPQISIYRVALRRVLVASCPVTPVSCCFGVFVSTVCVCIRRPLPLPDGRLRRALSFTDGRGGGRPSTAHRRSHKSLDLVLQARGRRALATLGTVHKSLMYIRGTYGSAASPLAAGTGVGNPAFARSVRE